MVPPKKKPTNRKGVLQRSIRLMSNAQKAVVNLSDVQVTKCLNQINLKRSTIKMISKYNLKI